MRRPPTVAATLAAPVVGMDVLLDNVEEALLIGISRDLASKKLSLPLAASIRRSKTAGSNAEHG
jgi:hypothetical protein